MRGQRGTAKGIRAAAALLLALVLPCLSVVGAAADGLDTCYTYTYDYWVDIRESPDAYRVRAVMNSSSLGLEVPIRNPKGLYVRGNNVYLCDTGNNRILEIAFAGGTYTLTRIIDRVYGADVETLNGPQDIFVDDIGQMYVCDTNNNRVVMMDRDQNFLMAYTKPTDETFDQSLSYLPAKLVVDVSGRVFALSTNVNKGLIKYEKDGTFTGFIGASKVKFNWVDYIWKLLSTKEQRSKQEAFVPTEYDNIAMDRKGFIFAVTSTFAEEELLNGDAKVIRRLNAIGDDILVRNDRYYPSGDLDWTDEGDVSGPSKMTDITVLDNDIYIALDRVRGRLFGYDTQGIMLWAFGGVGNSDGYFLNPVALDHMGTDLLVLDANECSVTVFTTTEYGALIYAANERYIKGDYDGSAELWREVLRLNGNYNLGFIGIGRSLLRQEKYAEAMEYFRYPRNFQNYSEAFRLYRKEWVEQNIGWIFGLLVALTVTPLVIGKVRKIKAEVSGS